MCLRTPHHSKFNMILVFLQQNGVTQPLVPRGRRTSHLLSSNGSWIEVRGAQTVGARSPTMKN